MKLLKKLSLVFIGVTSLTVGTIFPHESAQSQSSKCSFYDGYTYDHSHKFSGGGNFLGDMRITSSSKQASNGVLVKKLRGKWRVGYNSSDYNTIEINISGSTFSMTRYMHGGLIQNWQGQCRNGVVTGIVFDPTVGQGSFRIEM